MPQVKPHRSLSLKRKKAQRTLSQFFTLRRFSGFVFLMGLCILALWAHFHGNIFLSGINTSLEKGFASLGLKLEDVLVEGRVRTDKTLILKELGLERGKPLLSINLIEAKEKLQGLSWIKAVRIERRLPDTLFIRISEKEPVALWLNQSKTYLVDKDGELVETKEAYKYKGLPLITGGGAPSEIGKLMTLLEKFPEIKSRVTAATHLRPSRWDIRLDNKLEVKLPEREADQALAYFLELEKSHSLIEKDVMTIDMRLPGQLILRLRTDVVQEKNRTGKDA